MPQDSAVVVEASGLPYGLLADAVVVIHGLYIVFVVLGALLALRWSWVLWLHAPAALWGAWVELAGEVCPLTPVENRFRRLAGSGGYEGSFIETYLLPLIYPGALTREIQVGLGLFVVAVNVVLYGWVLRRSARAGS